jgi:hypothetical protein
MADGGDSIQTGHRKPRGKTKVSPIRNVIGLILLVVLVTVAVLEFSANRGYTAAMNKLTASMPSEDDPKAELLPMTDAEKIIGKAADGPAVKEEGLMKKTYTWRGAVRSYKLAAYYSLGAPSALVRFSNE